MTVKRARPVRARNGEEVKVVQTRRVEDAINESFGLLGDVVVHVAGVYDEVPDSTLAVFFKGVRNSFKAAQLSKKLRDTDGFGDAAKSIELLTGNGKNTFYGGIIRGFNVYTAKSSSRVVGELYNRLLMRQKELKERTDLSEWQPSLVN